MPQWKPPWPEGLSAVERWLLPAECLLCEGASGRSDDLVCAVCRSRWRRLPVPRCGRCGQPQDPGVDCRLCQSWPVGLRLAASAVWLDPAARRTVHLLKYDGWWRLADAMASTMTTLLSLPRAAVLVPVPLGAARQRSRGYNQSAKLAEALGRRLGLRIDDRLLARRRETATQTALTPEGRAANVAGAFAARRPARGLLVLVDDVFTTGATLVAATDALMAGGAERVAAVTFARAERPLEAVSRAVAMSSSHGLA